MLSTAPSSLVKTADFDVSEHQFVAYSEKKHGFPRSQAVKPKLLGLMTFAG